MGMGKVFVSALGGYRFALIAALALGLAACAGAKKDGDIYDPAPIDDRGGGPRGSH
jgi:hypothetical protein